MQKLSIISTVWSKEHLSVVRLLREEAQLALDDKMGVFVFFIT